jgi:hypothetical protein
MECQTWCPDAINVFIQATNKLGKLWTDAVDSAIGGASVYGGQRSCFVVVQRVSALTGGFCVVLQHLAVEATCLVWQTAMYVAWNGRRQQLQLAWAVLLHR